MHQAVFWNSSTIVTVLAVCLAHPISFILEKAELGSLDMYLQRNQQQLKVSHLTLAAEQLAQAIHYLVSLNYSS
jgi:Protein tyrosine and serine/threonine kinase